MASAMVVPAEYEEQVLREKNVVSTKLDENDCAVFDINLSGPTFVRLSNIGNSFVQPGDTLDVFTASRGCAQVLA